MSYDEPVQNLLLEGRKAVLEALKHEKPIDRLLVRKDKDKPVEGTLRLICAKAKANGVVVREVERGKLDEISESGHHQGVIALCPAVSYAEIEDIIALAKERGEPPFILLLDGVTDPHNLGAVIRSAEAGGVHGVVIPKRRAVGLTGTVAKTSAGAIEHMLIARVTNITACIEKLQTLGVWVVCADMEGQSLFEPEASAFFSGPLALVLGAEGTGVSRLAAEKCDFQVKIPMMGKIASLNVSVAAGIFIFEAVRRRMPRPSAP
jgi:23S rRNA (guanosine2251-2'-O)-methyltransferase